MARSRGNRPLFHRLHVRSKTKSGKVRLFGRLSRISSYREVFLGGSKTRLLLALACGDFRLFPTIVE